MPSSNPLCASIAPRTQSPTAQTPSTPVQQCSSTSMRPRASTFTPVPSPSTPSVYARRPTATSSLSTTIFCSPLASAYVTSTVSPLISALLTLSLIHISEP